MWECSLGLSCWSRSVSRPTGLFASVNYSTHQGTLRHQPSPKWTMWAKAWCHQKKKKKVQCCFQAAFLTRFKSKLKNKNLCFLTLFRHSNSLYFLKCTLFFHSQTWTDRVTFTATPKLCSPISCETRPQPNLWPQTDLTKLASTVVSCSAFLTQDCWCISFSPPPRSSTTRSSFTPPRAVCAVKRWVQLLIEPATLMRLISHVLIELLAFCSPSLWNSSTSGLISCCRPLLPPLSHHFSQSKKIRLDAACVLCS